MYRLTEFGLQWHPVATLVVHYLLCNASSPIHTNVANVDNGQGGCAATKDLFASFDRRVAYVIYCDN